MEGMSEVVQTGTGSGPARKRRPAWAKPFLVSLEKTGSVSRASRVAGIIRTQAYKLRETRPDFALEWDAALANAAEVIETEAIRRAVKGVVRYKFYKGKPIAHPEHCLCGHHLDVHTYGGRCHQPGCQCPNFLGKPYKERGYSDPLLALLLKGLLPEKYREGLGLAPEEVDAFIERRVAEMAEARANQIISRNGTARPPGPAPQISPPPDSGSAGPPDPSPSEEFPRRPPWLPPEGFPPRNQAGGP
jgi:hypothetical protein